MGFLPEHRYRAGLPWSDEEDALETDVIGNLGNVRETSALQVIVEEVEVVRGNRTRREGRARYGEEVPVEFGASERRSSCSRKPKISSSTSTGSCSAGGTRGAATSATPSTWTSTQATAW